MMGLVDPSDSLWGSRRLARRSAGQGGKSRISTSTVFSARTLKSNVGGKVDVVERAPRSSLSQYTKGIEELLSNSKTILPLLRGMSRLAWS